MAAECRQTPDDSSGTKLQSLLLSEAPSKSDSQSCPSWVLAWSALEQAACPSNPLLCPPSPSWLGDPPAATAFPHSPFYQRFKECPRGDCHQIGDCGQYRDLLFCDMPPHNKMWELQMRCAIILVVLQNLVMHMATPEAS